MGRASRRRAHVEDRGDSKIGRSEGGTDLGTKREHPDRLTESCRPLDFTPEPSFGPDVARACGLASVAAE